MTLAPGARLGPYEIVGAIGSGGMGDVYRARDRKLGREVALKILPASFTHDPDRVARFRREAQLLAALNHPQIAQIHGLEEASGTPFLVLELVDGASLADRVKHGPLPIDDALAIGRQIAAALEATHEKGIIHRDLKPANIVLTQDGAGQSARLWIGQGSRRRRRGVGRSRELSDNHFSGDEDRRRDDSRHGGVHES